MNKNKLPFLPVFDEGSAMRVQYRNPYEWIESSYIDDRSTQTEFIGRTVTDKRITVLYWILSALLITFVGKTIYLQGIKGSGLALLAERNRTKIVTLQAHRGIFYDRNGKILVRNIPDFSFAITLADISRDEHLFNRIIETASFYTGKTKEDITSRLKQHNSNQPFILIEQLSYQQALQLETEYRGIQGIEIMVSEKRSYEMTPERSISHVVGYTGRISEEQLVHNPDTYILTDTIGKSGLEHAYEDVIRGVSGRKDIEVDALGHERGVTSERESQDGSNLILSLDWNIQIKTEKVLADVMKKYGKSKGVVIATDPRNGEILAYVSLPAFDANMFAEGISSEAYEQLLNDKLKPLMSRGTIGEYPSGSTIKMLVAAAALEEKIITPSTSVISSGGIRIGDWFFPDWKNGGHGKTNVIKALAESVNTFFYAVSGGYQRQAGLGIDTLVAYLKKFGIGEETHVDFHAERPGFLPTPEWKTKSRNEPWYIGDTYHMAIGQGDILVTPLQVNAYTSYFAQKGINYEPHIIRAVESKGKYVLLKEIEPKVYKHSIVSQETVEMVRKGLRAGVTDGSSRRLLSLPVNAAGKTGTAQWSSSKSPHAWFTGWAPFEKPTIVLTVLIEEGEEGSKTAMNVAHDVLQWYFREYKKSQK